MDKKISVYGPVRRSVTHPASHYGFVTSRERRAFPALRGGIPPDAAGRAGWFCVVFRTFSRPFPGGFPGSIRRCRSGPRMRGWLFLGCAIVLEVAGSLSLKGALSAPGWYAVVVTGYVGAFVLLWATLRTGMPLGVAYGIWGAAGVALTAVMSFFLFAEPVTPLMALGILAIMAGVLCVELGRQAAEKRSGGEA